MSFYQVALILSIFLWSNLLMLSVHGKVLSHPRFSGIVQKFGIEKLVVLCAFVDSVIITAVLVGLVIFIR